MHEEKKVYNHIDLYNFQEILLLLYFLYILNLKYYMPPLYRPPTLPIYDGPTDSKQFLMSYEATISSYGGNSAVMAKSFVMAVRSVA
jgi:hypothetical protein